MSLAGPEEERGNSAGPDSTLPRALAILEIRLSEPQARTQVLVKLPIGPGRTEWKSSGRACPARLGSPAGTLPDAMFECLDDRARRVIVLAQEEARM